MTASPRVRVNEIVMAMTSTPFELGQIAVEVVSLRSFHTVGRDPAWWRWVTRQRHVVVRYLARLPLGSAGLLSIEPVVRKRSLTEVTAYQTVKGSSEARAANGRPRRLAWAAILGVVVYVLLDVVTQLLPPHYNPLTQAESDLSVGPFGWMMRINFVVRGLLSASLLGALVLSLRPTTRGKLGLWLWGCWSAGAFVLAAFNTDLGGAEHTVHGKIHVGVALIAFVAAPIAAILLSQSLASEGDWGDQARWATISAYSSLGLLVLMVLLTKAGVGGLTERLFLASVLFWVVVVGVGVVRSTWPATQDEVL